MTPQRYQSRFDSVTRNEFGAINEAAMPGFAHITPTFSILAADVPIDVSIERFNELAAALGADINAAAVTADRQASTAASEVVRTVILAMTGLKTIAISPATDAVRIGNPSTASDLIYFAELGLEMVVPEAPQAYASDL